jgi:hypothetical protein
MKTGASTRHAENQCPVCNHSLYDNPAHFDPKAGTSGLYRFCPGQSAATLEHNHSEEYQHGYQDGFAEGIKHTKGDVTQCNQCAGVAEVADAADLKSANHVGSNPAARTNQELNAAYAEKLRTGDAEVDAFFARKRAEVNEVSNMLHLRKELDPDAPDAVVIEG